MTNVLVLVLYRHAMQNAMIAYPETRKVRGDLHSKAMKHQPVRKFNRFQQFKVVIANETWRKQTDCPEPSGRGHRGIKPCRQRRTVIAWNSPALPVFAKLPANTSEGCCPRSPRQGSSSFFAEAMLLADVMEEAKPVYYRPCPALSWETPLPAEQTSEF